MPREPKDLATHATLKVALRSFAQATWGLPMKYSAEAADLRDCAGKLLASVEATLTEALGLVTESEQRLTLLQQQLAACQAKKQRVRRG